MKQEANVWDTNIRLYNGGVLDVKVDAIVNAANASLLGGGGVDGAIHRAAGPDLLKECYRLGGCMPGDAKKTKAYHLRTAQMIFHTVGPVYTGAPSDATTLASCYLRCLDLAAEHHVRSIAFPCISTGVYGYPLEEAAKIALMSISDWLREHPKALTEIVLCCYREEEYEIYAKLLSTES